MKEYTNPPLIYVKSHLWWHLRSKEEHDKCGLLSGILHPDLSKILPNIALLKNELFNGITYSNEKDHLITQIINSEFSLISMDENYSWNSFKKYVFDINELVIQNLNNLIAPDHVHGQLEYLDFFEFDYTNHDLTEFLRDYLKIEIRNTLIPDLDNFELTMSQKLDNGSLKMNYILGENSEGKKGIIVKFTNDSPKLPSEGEKINNWFESSHSICKSFFNELIEGKLKDQIL